MWPIMLDLLLVVIAGTTVFFAVKRGLVKTVINAFSLVLSAVLSLFLSPFFKSYINFSGEHGDVANYFVVFLISWIIVKIASILLDKIISSLPIIRTINSLGGFIIGVVLGVLRISLYCIAVGSIIAFGDNIGIEFLKDVSIDDTVLLKYIYEYNPIYLLVNLIM